MASNGHRVWTAAARALRTPSLIDRGLHVEYPAALAIPALRLRREIAAAAMPVFVGGLGNPHFHNERLIDVEAGYRLTVTRRASFDVVAFRGRYDDLQTFEPLPPVVQSVNGQPVLKVFSRQENLLRADTRGAEVSGRVQIGGGWHLDGGLATFSLTPHPMGSQDPSLTDYDSHAPAYQWRTHAAMPLSRRGQADVHFFRTGPIDSADVPAIARLDARVEWSLTRRVSLVASGQNLLRPSHLEFNGDKTVLESTHIPRSGGLRLVWRF